MLTGAAGLAAPVLAAGTATAAGEPASAPDPQFLDEAPTHVADVTVDDVAHSIFRLRHRVLSADGIEVYAAGERVTDADAVDTAFHRLGWREAVTAHVTTDTVDSMRYVRDVASEIRDVVGPVYDVLDDALDVVEDLQATGFAGVSAWDVIESVSPSIATVVDVIQGAHALVSPWDRATSEAASAIRELASEFDGLREPSTREDVFFDRQFADQFGRVDVAVTDLAGRTAGLYSRFTNVRDEGYALADALRVNVDAILDEAPDAFPSDVLRGLVGDVASAVEDAGDAVVEAAGPVREFRNETAALDGTLAKVTGDADARKSDLTLAWEARLTVPTRVTSLAALAGLVAVYVVASLFGYGPGNVDWPIEPPFGDP